MSKSTKVTFHGVSYPDLATAMAAFEERVVAHEAKEQALSNKPLPQAAQNAAMSVTTDGMLTITIDTNQRFGRTGTDAKPGKNLRVATTHGFVEVKTPGGKVKVGMNVIDPM